MISHIIVSGEGPSDLGGSFSGQAALSHDEDFEKGPFFYLVERMLNKYLPVWNKDIFETNPLSITYVSHGYLKKQSKKVVKGEGRYAFSGKSGEYKDNLGKLKQARELGKLAIEQDCQLAIYFHDTDGNNKEKSLTSPIQSKIVKAVDQGFKSGKMNAGIAMIPRPTSEAWLICSCKNNYLHCESLEATLSGNDRSEDNDPKKILANYLGISDCDNELLTEKINNLDLEKMDMPSFNQFRDDLKSAIKTVCGSIEN